MILKNEEELIGEGIQSPFNFNPAIETNIDAEMVQIKTEEIDKKMIKKGYKPLVHPTDEQLRYVIRGSLSRKTGSKATSFTTIDPLLVRSHRTCPVTFNDRVYIADKVSLVTRTKDEDFENADINYIMPIYTDRNEKPKTLYFITIDNEMLKRKK
jgi:hypothetical protein